MCHATSHPSVEQRIHSYVAMPQVCVVLVAGGSSTRRPHTRHNSSSGHGAAAAASDGRPPPPAAECVRAPAVFWSPATPRHHSYLLHRRHYANESRDGHVTREIFHTLRKYLTHAAHRRAAATCTMHATFRIVDLPAGECSARGAGWCWLCLHPPGSPVL